MIQFSWIDIAILISYFISIILISFIATITARSSRFLYFILNANMVRDLRNFSFQKIELNSHNFFANTFAGSLVTKSRRFSNSFERMLEIFLYNFLNFFTVLIGSLVFLFLESLTLCLIFSGFVIVNVFVVSLFIKRKVKYDVLDAEQDSKISGRLADIYSNILAVKFFSAREREINSFGRYTEEGANRSKKAMFFGAGNRNEA